MPQKPGLEQKEGFRVCPAGFWSRFGPCYPHDSSWHECVFSVTCVLEACHVDVLRLCMFTAEFSLNFGKDWTVEF